MVNFSNEFIAFSNEAAFAKEILGLGVTQIRKANYAMIGKYYQSFSCLTTGLERIGKLCILLDKILERDLNIPNLKKDFSHDLTKLYKQLIVIKEKWDLKNKNTMPPHALLDKILNILTDFACKDRYSNLDFLIGQVTKNLVELWYKDIDLYIYDHYVTERKKQQIETNAEIISLMANSNVSVVFTGEDNSFINDIRDASIRMGVFDTVAPKRQFLILQIVRFFCNLLSELGSLVQQKQLADVPYFSEIVGCFLCPDDYFKSRKCWDNI